MAVQPAGKSVTECRGITDEERDAFARDGVVPLRQLVPQAGVALIRQVIDDEISQSWRAGHPSGPVPSRGRFHNDGFLWQRHDALRGLCLAGSLPASVAALLCTPTVRLLMDEVFVKEPATDLAVPWHTDASYWPVSGRAMMSIWIALDEVDARNGAVRFLPASHRRGEIHEPASFLGHDAPPVSLAPDDGTVSWPLVPGDALAFHAYTLHSSPGNLSSDRRRRAYSIRYAGADVRYQPRDGTSAMMTVPGLKAGSVLPAARFPIAWSSPSA